jgi:nucleotide-binding universal stress UspA family protein
MFKDILLPLVLGEIHEPAVLTACSLGSAFDAHVVALAGVSIVAPVATTWAYYPAGIYATMHESAQATVHELAEAVRRRLARESAAHEVRASEQFWLTPTEQAIAHARYADLIVLGAARRSRDAEAKLFAGLLMAGGRPLILVPPEAETREPGHVVIAWKPTREASRALHDAMPLLQRARSIDLLMVEGDYKSSPRGEPADVHVLAHLARHGLDVTLVRRNHVENSTGDTILAHARESGADLIVAGGYSHARAVELVFGGVTRTLLERASVPVLFSH